ncbi:eukaryotic translation initiation factor 4 gamma 1-like [Hemibagrus wyckioides]|uniref:eukaryotic translation initiation factor 4 gamma 1-like n=1 Tax=Hemibagrus wyckioides TaxID=337641 RepID=UPI00266BFE05|nr:eukaryotic translation initiation factor 4 gamma 1-like [Hemibagrus wyckioides]
MCKPVGLLDIPGVVLDKPRQSEQNLLKRPGLLLFSIPPEEEVQQQKMEKVNTQRRKKQNTTEVQKTQSQKKPRELVSFFIPLTEEEKEEAKKANIVYGDFLSDYLTPTGVDTVEAAVSLQTTPLKEVEPDNTPEPASVEVQPSGPRPTASPSDPKERKMYDREFMLSLRFVSASMRTSNIRFIGELFKLNVLKEQIMHTCIVKLLKNHDEESLECLCRLLSTIGKNLDLKQAKVTSALTHTQTLPNSLQSC